MADREMTIQTCQRGSQPARAQKRNVRKDGWTQERRTQFLQVLRETCNVSEAVRAVGMNLSSVYELRKRDEDFDDAWQEALDLAYEDLEMWVMQQARKDQVVTIHEGDPKDGKIKSTRTVSSCPTPILMRLLMAHRERVERYRMARAAARRRERMEREKLEGTLAGMRQRLMNGGALLVDR